MSDTLEQKPTTGCSVVPIAILQRVRAEFLEMPGLRLTAAQARRL